MTFDIISYLYDLMMKILDKIKNLSIFENRFNRVIGNLILIYYFTTGFIKIRNTVSYIKYDLNIMHIINLISLSNINVNLYKNKIKTYQSALLIY